MHNKEFVHVTWSVWACDGECVCVPLHASKHNEQSPIWVYTKLSVFSVCVCLCAPPTLIGLCNFTFVECILKHSHKTLLSQLRVCIMNERNVHVYVFVCVELGYWQACHGLVNPSLFGKWVQCDYPWIFNAVPLSGQRPQRNMCHVSDSLCCVIKYMKHMVGLVSLSCRSCKGSGSVSFLGTKITHWMKKMTGD